MLVVFIDDEPRILEGIERMLFSQDQDWKIICTTDPQEVLSLVTNTKVDVVVSDMRMPLMDGATLLHEVQKRRPETVRIILSGHSEEESALKALSAAHQFLCKPCSAESLISTVERVYLMRDLLHSDRLVKLVGKIKRLPPTPALYIELTKALNNPNTTSDNVAAVVRRDPSLAAKVLQLCNSAFFGRGRPVSDIRTAVTHLGLRVIRNVALTTEVFQSEAPPGVNTEWLQRVALVASDIAPRLLGPKRDVDLATTSALLANVGMLVPGVYRGVGHAVSFQDDLDDDDAPQHYEAGAYLLGLWGIPMPIVEAVAFRAHPAKVERDQFGLIGATHVATALACGEDIDEAYLEAVGVHGRLNEWRRYADSARMRAGV